MMMMNISQAVRLSVGLCLALGPLVTWPQQDQNTGADRVIEEVIVTGSYIRRPAQADSPAPLSTITRQDLIALGANEISDVIERLTINTGSQNNPDAFTQNFTTVAVK